MSSSPIETCIRTPPYYRCSITDCVNPGQGNTSGTADTYDWQQREGLSTGRTKVYSMAGSAWLSLLVAGAMETGWAIGLKYTEGFSRLVPSVLTIALMAGSFYFLSKSLATLPVGTAYAVWTGIGAVGTVILGMVLFGESRDLLRILCLLLIISGIVGLKMVSVD